MKRSKRLEPVGTLADEVERECAAEVASVLKRLAEAERRFGVGGATEASGA